jgi:hypothetical protein
MSKTLYALNVGMSFLLELVLATAQQHGQKTEARMSKNSRRRTHED